MSSEHLILCESALPAEDSGGLEPRKERRDEGYRSAFVQTRRAGVGVELKRGTIIFPNLASIVDR